MTIPGTEEGSPARGVRPGPVELDLEGLGFPHMVFTVVQLVDLLAHWVTLESGSHFSAAVSGYS